MKRKRPTLAEKEDQLFLEDLVNYLKLAYRMRPLFDREVGQATSPEGASSQPPYPRTRAGDDIAPELDDEEVENVHGKR